MSTSPRYMYFKNIALVLALMSRIVSVTCRVQTNETLLRKHLFYGCDCHIRPVVGFTDTLQVYLDYSPIYLHNLDGVQQIFSIYGWLGTKWYIPYLKWDPDEYGGTNFITVAAQDIWFPNLGVINSIDDLYGDIFTKEDREGKLYSDGSFRINRPGTWNTICMLDVTYFPFDQQVCHIEIDSWALPIPQLELMGNGSVIKMSKMRPNGQWEVVNAWVHVERTGTTFSGYTTLSFVFKLKRKPQYVALNFVLPCIGILLMELLMFMIPPDAGEKISLGITLLLAQTVFQLVMHEDLPESSDQFPVINTYILLAMMMSGLEIISSCIVLNLHHRPDGHEISPLVRHVIFDVMAKVLRVRMKRNRKYTWKVWDASAAHKHVANENVDAAVKDEEDDEEEVTWVNVARVIDRFFFYLFLLLTVGITATCLMLSYFSPEDNDVPLAGYGYDYYPLGSNPS